jgi:hypothetical protein
MLFQVWEGVIQDKNVVKTKCSLEILLLYEIRNLLWHEV